MPGVGVFVCGCGPNIEGRVNVGKLVKFARGLDGVSYAEQHRLYCSAEGKDTLAEAIRTQGLSRVVIAGCSPREHEKTFIEVCQRAGLNPYLMHMVNIREQCAWVVGDPVGATEKAQVLIRAGVMRAARLEALETKEIDCIADALVVGAGVAGIEAALTLAQKGRKVFVVESSPAVGGHAVRYEEVFPDMECGSCMLEPKMDDLLHSDNISVLTNSRVEEVVGYHGNFTVRVRSSARKVDGAACLGCIDECSGACPVSVPNEANDGLDQRKAIYVPYPGALPNLALIDEANCLRSKGKECTACADACPFAAVVLDQEDEVVELKVGAVVLATGFGLLDASTVPGTGYGTIPEVYTSLEFEKLISSDGPTGGQLVKKDGSPPSSVAFVHCVGSRTKAHREYCSGACCMYTMKLAHLVRGKLPDADVYEIHGNLTVAAKGYTRLPDLLTEDGVKLLRTSAPEKIAVRTEGDSCVVAVPGHGGSREVRADMVVLSMAMTPAAGTAELAAMFEVPLDEYGFFQEEHGRLGAIATSIEGVQIAGCAQGPMDIQSSVVQGAAAAGKILSSLVPGEKLKLEVIVAWVDEDVCGGCKTCVSMCPYKAVSYDESRKAAAVNEALCKGCGTCVSACPAGALHGRHFTAQQVYAEIEGVMS